MSVLHGTRAQVAELEEALTGGLIGLDRAATLARLAWILRERDTRQAAALARAALDQLDSLPRDAGVQAVEARARLALAATSVIAQPPAQADADLAEAARACRDLGDMALLADCHLVTADRAQDDGDPEGERYALEEAEAIFRDIGCAEGVGWAQAQLAAAQAHGPEAVAGEVILRAILARAEQSGQTILQAAALLHLGLIAADRGDSFAAIDMGLCALRLADAEGMPRKKAQAGLFLGMVHGRSRAFDNALAMLAEAEGWARALGDRLTLGKILNIQAFTRIGMNQPDTAGDHHARAAELLGAYPRSRAYAVNRLLAGQIALLEGRSGESALVHQQVLDITRTLGHRDLEQYGLRGLGESLARLGRADEAQRLLEQGQAKAAAGGNAYAELFLLQALAALARGHVLPGPKGRQAPSTEIAYLEWALERARGLGEQAASPELLEQLSRAYEAAGDLARALEYQRASSAALNRVAGREAQDRHRRAEAQLELERARAEAERSRAEARAEQARADALASSARTLRLMARMGQDLTATLDLEMVFEGLRRQIAQLMDVDVMAVALARPAEQRIDFPYIIVYGRRLAGRAVPMDRPGSLTARVIREEREMVFDEGQIAAAPMFDPGGDRLRSAAFLPLRVGGRMLGSLTVQSRRDQAYGERELDILRTLAAFGATALANAEAYRSLDQALADLRSAQALLVQQEKLAALGQLVAGVAHEVNTPLGTALSGASALSDAFHAVAAKVREGRLRRSDMDEHLADGAALSALIERNLVRAAELVRSFKDTAADQAMDDRRRFDLPAYVREVVDLVMPRLRKAAVAVQLTLPEGLAMDSYPGAVAQVLTNLLVNAADHAFEPDQGGTIQVTVVPLAVAGPPGGDSGPGLAEITVEDDGRGIPPEVVPRLFDPFFTTRRSQGNTGLGMHIVFNLVHQRLGGSIVAGNRVGRGARFTVRIPCKAPETAPRTDASDTPVLESA